MQKETRRVVALEQFIDTFFVASRNRLECIECFLYCTPYILKQEINNPTNLQKKGKALPVRGRRDI